MNIPVAWRAIMHITLSRVTLCISSSTRQIQYLWSRSQRRSEMLRFELCRLPQQPSLTLHPLGGSTPRMWPLFLLRAKGKRKEMTGTQHVGALKHKFLQFITIKNVFVLFHYQNNFKMNYSSAIWWRHLPAACNNLFEAGVSGNKAWFDLSINWLKSWEPFVID
jgi:hypothetical protein